MSANERLAMPAGSLVALATPMTNDGLLDIPALRSVLQWHKAEGTDGVVILGTTGEASTLSYEEKEEVDDHIMIKNMTITIGTDPTAPLHHYRRGKLPIRIYKSI